MTDERYYSHSPSKGVRFHNPRKSFVEMLEENDERIHPRPPPDNRNGSAENDASLELADGGETFTAEDLVNCAGIGPFQTKLVILCAFVWMARAFDSVLTEFLSCISTCEWKLYRWHGAVMYTLTTISNIVGCILYGNCSDRYGRRTALSASLIFVFVFGAVSAGLPTYPWYLICRMATAFSIGGLIQGYSLCSEYISGAKRGRSVFILSSFWGLGVIILLGFLYTIIGPTKSNWRYFAGFASVPSGIAMIMMRFFPESIRFLLVSEEYYPAVVIMKEMAKRNKMILPPGRLLPCSDRRNRGSFAHLFRGKYARSSRLFLFMGLTTTIALFALNGMIPFLAQEELNSNIYGNMAIGSFLGNMSSPIRCFNEVNDDQFLRILWTNALDFPAYLLYILLVDFVDRKVMLCASFSVSSLCTFLLFIYYIKESSVVRILTSTLLLISKTLLTGQMDMLFLMTAETFPTALRGTAIGLMAADCAFGNLMSPYIVEGVLSLGIEALTAFCAVMSLVSAAASIFLPLETRGRQLTETTKES